MKVIEQNIVGKKGAEACEDEIVITDNFIAVIDGSTSKSTRGKFPTGETSGQLAARIVARIIKDSYAEMGLWEMCQHFNGALNDIGYRYYDNLDRSLLKDFPEERLCCSAIIYSRYWNEIWQIGDCHGLIVEARFPDDKGMHITNNKPYESKLAKKRSEYLNQALTEGVSVNGQPKRVYTVEELRRHDIGRDYILPDLLEAMKGENIDYAVIDGFPIPQKKIKCWGDFAPGREEIVFATDGYPRLFRTLAESEAYLQKCLEADPLCIKRNKATKGWMEGTVSFDDRAYVRFSI